jgi:glycine hydroxymethyltransferase
LSTPPPAATSRGLKEDDFDKVAEAIAMIIKEGESAVEPAKAIIKTLTDKYPLAF